MLTLYPFQQKALDDTRDKNRVAYYFDMGLGKTFIGSAKLNQLAAPKTLLVCQKSKISDWCNHFEIYHPNCDVFNLTEKPDYDGFIHIPLCPDLHKRGVLMVGIINYDLIFRRSELLTLENFTLVLDESSLIQNSSAKRTRAILKMNPANVILLSGTPTAGKYENLWSQLQLLGWSISQKAYDQTYVNWRKIDVGGFVHKIACKDNPYKNVERLKSKMRGHGAVFMKTDEVFDLPAQNIIEVKVPRTREYEHFEKHSIVEIGGETLVGDSILSKRIYSRMLCGHYNEGKLTAFRDICESTHDRLIVFYNYDAELAALRDICAALERPVAEVNGHTKDLTAYEAETDSITLIQYKAGSKGVNLQKANKMIFFTPTDSCEDWQQGLKRIHRIGQLRPCFYYKLVCENSIEEQIYVAIERGVNFTEFLFVRGGDYAKFNRETL